MKKTTRLRQLLAGPALVRAPGAFDGLSAKLIEAAGFDVVYMTGYGASASVLGEPDVGLMTLSEMAGRAGAIANAVDIPVIADADTGFGNPLNVRRTVREYERAGVCGIQLEDQVAPKRCGHMVGREVIPAADMVQKVRAAADARIDEEFVIVARTDARTTLGIDASLDRARAYADAGADVIFVESPETVDELAAIAAAFPGKATLANMVEGGRTPVLPPGRLQSLGFRIAIYPVGPLFAAARAMDVYLKALREGASLPDVTSFADFNRLIGLPDYLSLQERYKS